MPGPRQELKKLPSRLPSKTENVGGTHILSSLAGIRLYAPFDIGASPRRESLAARGIP